MFERRANCPQISWFRHHFGLSIKSGFSLMKTLKRGSEESPLEEPMSSKNFGVFISQHYFVSDVFIGLSHPCAI